jgi:ureidoglycolate hydrolase
VTSTTIEKLSPQAFAPFGRVVMPPRDDPNATGPGWRWWAEVSLLAGEDRVWGIGWLDLTPAPPRFDWAERHFRTEEAVFATSSDLLVYVGPAEHPERPERLCELEQFRVFRVPAGSGVVLNRGVWHGAPLALRPTTAVVLILEGTGERDVTVVRFHDTPVNIEMSPLQGEAVDPRPGGRDPRPEEE